MFRPRGWPEAVAAVPAAGLLIATGVVSPHDALAEVNRLLPVVGFLAAVLVLAKLCDDEGLFHAAGVAMARRSAGEPRRLLGTVFVIAASHDGDPEPGRDRRAADAGGAGDRANAGHPVPAARLRHRAPGQHRVTAVAGVESDQPAGLQRGRSHLRALQRRHGGAMAPGDRGRIPPASAVLPARTDGRARTRRAAATGRHAGVRARRARAHARRIRGHVAPGTCLLPGRRSRVPSCWAYAA